MPVDLDLHHLPPKAIRTDYTIAVVGAGFIVRDVQLKAYADAGLQVVGITSRHIATARDVAALRNIPQAFETVAEMVRENRPDILDIAIPPDRQFDAIREALDASPALKGILAQKPLAVTYEAACQTVAFCKERGVTLAVNQNMRYDQSIRALKTLLTRGYLGTPVLATMEMRAVPHWQPWLRDYNRLTLLNMSIHHLDTFRYLFGDPESIFVSARKDPRTAFAHEDGICLYLLEYAEGLRATAWDDVWTGPRSERDDLNPYIKWRVEGTEGVAEGTIGWPRYPNHTPSTLTFTTTAEPGIWFTPRWDQVWFPDAFAGPMSDLMDAITTLSEPACSGTDNLRTMALVEAGYKSLRERRLVSVAM